MLLLLAIACATDPRLDRLEREVAELRAEIEVCPTRRDVDQGAPDDEGVCPDVGGPWSESVVPIGPETYLVDPVCWHSVVDGADSRRLQARIIYRPGPSPDDLDGWRLSGLPRSSLLAAVGLHNGDVVLALNGRAAADLDAHDIEAAALGSDRLVMTGLRRGRPFRTEVDVAASTFAASCGTVDAAVEPEQPAAVAVPEVRVLGDDRYAIDADWVARQLSDVDALSKMARAIPHRGPDGEIDGYRLSGIRVGSPLDALGIKNGDVVKAVNGVAITSPEAAESSFLTGTSTFTFAVVRRGEPRTLTYEITR